jgi:membrane protein YdbS with pleckstrin-like domain
MTTTIIRTAAPSACTSSRVCTVDAVSDQTAVPATPQGPSDPARLDPVAGPWKRVSSRFLWVDLIGSVIGTIVFTAVASLPVLLSGSLVLLVIPAVIFVIGVIIAAFTPRRVRAIGYQLRADDFLVRRGIMFQRFAAVPYGRMQLVDINRGPLDRALGLAELKLVTAASASNVAVPGLPMADAEELRDRLVELAESRRAGL